MQAGRLRMFGAKSPCEDLLYLHQRRLGLDHVFFVCIILFCVAAAVYLLADLLVAAAPVVMLASFVAVSQMASYASRRVVGQWGGAGGASCEEHFEPGELASVA